MNPPKIKSYNQRIKCMVAVASDRYAWNKFVGKLNGSIYHRWEWSIILKKSINSNPIFFVAKDQKQKIVGIMPLYKNIERSGDMLVSLVCTGYVDPLALNEDIVTSLLYYILSWCTRHKMTFEIVTKQRLNRLPEGVYQRTDGVCDFTANTTQPFEGWLTTSLDNDKLRRLRKAKKIGVFVRNGNMNDISDFYLQYLHAMKGAGVMGLPKSIYVNTFKYLSSFSLLLQSTSGNGDTAYLWGFIHLNTIYLWKNGYIKGSSKKSIYYEKLIECFMRRACDDKNINIVDFSTAWCNSGLAAFKRKWGFQGHPVYIWSNIDTSYKITLKDKAFSYLIKYCPYYIYRILN